MVWTSFNVALLLTLALAPGSASPHVAAAHDDESIADTRKHIAPPITHERWSPVQIVIYKSKRSLAVYRAGNFDKAYRVVLGFAPEGRKRHASDARTPEGEYRIVAKRKHDRWQHFLALDYPNADDRRSYEVELRSGTIPDEDGEPFGIGDAIGIHGNDREADQAAGKDWTKGCVALSAGDIDEVAEAVPVGTPVWIVK